MLKEEMLSALSNKRNTLGVQSNLGMDPIWKGNPVFGISRLKGLDWIDLSVIKLRISF